MNIVCRTVCCLFMDGLEAINTGKILTIENAVRTLLSGLNVKFRLF